MKKVKVYNVDPVFSDQRGHIFDILEENVGHVGMVTFAKKGLARGKHYHKKSTQYTYILNGKVKLITSDVKGNNKNEFVLEKGAFAEIPPNVVHTYVSLSKAEMLDMTTVNRKKQGYEKDTIRVS
ncbi:MAG: cupin domain-containing protein [bacterium]|nr:cupin domain-containing protein [bacterium]